ncbi:MAG TPA: cytochrome c oxidase subunit I [Burkholderiaceae bacterium]|nr:cytochrome c oxidase subunit I [Burkholderiaceae bacterium]
MSALRRHRALERIWRNEPGWRGRFTSVNHTTLGLRFMVAAFVFFAIAGLLAMLIRAQLATPHGGFIGPSAYAQVFTMHGSIMMFLFAIPLLEGLAMYLLPKLLGARDLAFPRVSALGWWCYLFGGSILIAAMIAGVAPDSGWFLYPPLASKPYTPGINADVWLLGITFVEISALAAAIEIVVTVLKLRAAGMRLDRMPIYAWYLFATAGMMVFAFPPLILGSILLEVERAFGWPFYTADRGGSPLLWQHLFWLFGHPEVYIIFLPAAGAISTILPVLARTRLVGYGPIVAAVLALAFLSFGLWVHHMYTTGIPHMALGFFSAASSLVAVPTAVQIFSWLATLWQGRPQLKLPMLYLIGFFVVFVPGGLTGVMVAVVPFDQQAHDSAFITAHLHYVLVGGFVFPMMAAAYWWLPHMSGRSHPTRMGVAAFWLVLIGFNLTFLGMHLTGLLGMPRRIETYAADIGWTALNLVSSVGGFVQAIGFALFALDIGLQVKFGRRSQRDPWRAETLEWAMPTPPPPYNFVSLPRVESREPLLDDPELGVRLVRGEGLLAEARHGWRETLAVNIVTGEPEHIAVVPGNSLLPITMAAVLGGFFLSMLAGWYPVAPLFLVVAAAIGWRWATETGSPAAIGKLPAGGGLELPTQHEVRGGPGWWGSVITVAASVTLLASLLFGHAFLWTVSTDWPPPALVQAVWLEPLLVLVGAGLALWAGRRADAGAQAERSHAPVTLAICGQFLVFSALIALVAWRIPSPAEHAYAATAMAMAAYALFHVGLALMMWLFVRRRIASGHIAGERSAPLRIVRLWSGLGALSAAGIALLLVLPAWLA